MQHESKSLKIRRVESIICHINLTAERQICMSQDFMRRIKDSNPLASLLKQKVAEDRYIFISHASSCQDALELILQFKSTNVLT